jgi:hypothetical protein
LSILANAVRRTPKKWGVLRGSGYVTHPNNGSVTVGFGGPASAYAWVQHENMDFNHTVGGPKYLSNAVREVQPRATDIYARIVNRSLFAGGPLPPAGGVPSTPWEGPTKPNAKKGRKAKKKKAAASRARKVKGRDKAKAKGPRK